ncbi:MAG TPA: MBOAT family O-acyltransferase [Polyangiaceae bacterium]|nr:MBOAT family O-acyltransferase [Polyangiaceae bacterium]
MLFNSFPFALFFAITYAVFVLSPVRRRERVLLAASLVFYGLWVPTYFVLLLVMLGASYVLVRRMVTSPRPKAWLTANIVFSLSVLAAFKYSAFAVQLASPLLRGVLHLPVHAPYWVLPLGISFYTFEIVSLAVDIHREKLALPSFSRYLLFVTFFPHLIAGPIMRGAELLPQLDAGGERTHARTRRGLWLFAVGLVKKTIFSDFLLMPYVAEIFQAPGGPSGPAHLLAAYSFAFQIYFDFSGYSDMARGLACVLGFELPMNFEEPYLSRDPSEFWTRWHVTLSRWLRDYLYVPLGGNRHGLARTLTALMLTMLLGGLWHGAGIDFILWGGLHGTLLIAYRLLARRRVDRDAPLTWRDAPRVFLLFNLVSLAWVPFRAASVEDAVAFYRGVLRGGYLGAWPILPAAIVALSVASHAAERWLRNRLPAIHERIGAAAWGPAFEGGLLGAVLTASLLASGAGVEFIYFQF